MAIALAPCCRKLFGLWEIVFEQLGASLRAKSVDGVAHQTRPATDQQYMLSIETSTHLTRSAIATERRQEMLLVWETTLQFTHRSLRPELCPRVGLLITLFLPQLALDAKPELASQVRRDVVL